MTTPADTNEWRWVPVYHQTDPANEESVELYTGAVEYSVYRDGQTPPPYTPGVIRAGKTGILIQGLTPGTYRVRARVTGETADQPVIDAGTFTLVR